MGKRQAALAGRAWKLLKLALLWARKGGVLKQRLLPDYVKSLRAARSDMIYVGERQLSFDETPVFHFNMRRPRSMRMPHIPCINPGPVDFDDDDDDVLFDRDWRMGSLQGNHADEEEERRGSGRGVVIGGSDELAHEMDEEQGMEEEEKCVDVKAEEFIAKFYQQMKLQRQISLLQYNEMLLRSAS